MIKKFILLVAISSILPACSLLRVKRDAHVRVKRGVYDRYYVGEKNYSPAAVSMGLEVVKRKELQPYNMRYAFWSNYSRVFTVVGTGLMLTSIFPTDEDHKDDLLNAGAILTGTGLFIFPIFARKNLSDAVKEHNRLLDKKPNDSAMLQLRYNF